MSFSRGLLAVPGVVLVLSLTFLGGFLLGGQRSAGADMPGLSTLREVRQILNGEFLGDLPSPEEEAYGAIHGLVNAYNDPYTVFVEPAPRELERDDLRGHFGGIGAYLGRNEVGELVLTPIRDGPASKAGIQEGDVLVAIDGQPIPAEMPVDEVVALVRGDVGTEVQLTLTRPGQAESFAIIIVRDLYETPSVEWRLLDETAHLGYVRISVFGERTGQELQEGLAELSEQGVNQVVVDVRGNGGGLLDAAVDATSAFLKEDVVLREMRRGGEERVYTARRGVSPAHNWSLVLLVDGGTASASEILAGALRDHGRAVLIGENTYGKGSVQQVHDLEDGSSLHVTVSRWLTPDGHQLDEQGLAPDVVVGLTADDVAAGRDPQLAEAEDWLRNKRDLSASN